ncbi:hypothetical protein JVU11DRAFT_7603 [Chiua virens]|nr:hypothetical protein JVU11DRAFT_7603 [Chiua virens]
MSDTGTDSSDVDNRRIPLKSIPTNHAGNQDDDNDLLEACRKAGKKAAVLLDAFIVPKDAFRTGLDHDGVAATDTTQERQLRFYNGLLKLVPGLKIRIRTIPKSEREKVMQAVKTGMSEIRSADLSSLKHKGLKYVPRKMFNKADALDPPIPEVSDKSMRGIYHPQLARLLCPARELKDFDHNPDVGMEKLLKGDIRLKARKWPAFFYKEGSFDESKKTNGLFKGHIPARFYQHMFISPSFVMSEDDTKKSGRPSKNRNWGVRGINEYIIAYVHIITYVTLSHASQWGEVIGDMNLEDLYFRIIKIFEDKDDPWVKETLAWWER